MIDCESKFFSGEIPQTPPYDILSVLGLHSRITLKADDGYEVRELIELTFHHNSTTNSHCLLHHVRFHSKCKLSFTGISRDSVWSNRVAIFHDLLSQI